MNFMHTLPEDMLLVTAVSLTSSPAAEYYLCCVHLPMYHRSILYSHCICMYHIYMSSLVIAKTAFTSAEILHNRMGVIQLVCADSTGLRLAWDIDRHVRQYRQYIQINTDKLSCQN